VTSYEMKIVQNHGVVNGKLENQAHKLTLHVVSCVCNISWY
jgi:hypothetical protein